MAKKWLKLKQSRKPHICGIQDLRVNVSQNGKSQLSSENRYWLNNNDNDNNGINGNQEEEQTGKSTHAALHTCPHFISTYNAG